MTAALFGVTTLLVTLAKEGDAPKIFSKKLKFKELPWASLSLGSLGLSVSVLTALLLPEKIYEYITTAAGILLLYNWCFIILSFLKMTPDLTIIKKGYAWVGFLLLVAGVSGTLMDHTIRLGFLISFFLVGIIGGVTWFMNKKWKIHH